MLGKRNLRVVSVQFSRSVVSDSLQPHGLQHARPPCPSPAPRVYPNSCPLSQWCHPTISSSVIPFSSHLQSFPASGPFQMSQFFASGGQSIEVSASTSVLPMNTQDWSPLGWTGWISILTHTHEVWICDGGASLKTLGSPLDCQEVKSVNPKGHQSWIIIGRTDVEAATPILWPPDAKNWLIGEDPDAGKDWRHEEKGMTEDEIVGWYHRPDGHDFE